jgi:DNA-binding transcriptional MocR family regulator
MCLWVELPPEVDTVDVYHRALAAKITKAPGPIFSAKQLFRNFIRLNSGNPWSDKIEQAVRTLGRIIDSVRGGSNGEGLRPAPRRVA